LIGLPRDGQVEQAGAAGHGLQFLPDDRAVDIFDGAVDRRRTLGVRRDLRYMVGVVTAVAYAVRIVEVLAVQLPNLRGFIG